MNKINNIISETINHFLLEYSNEKRLPFEEDEFKNKNYLEQYTDWLEDFGKYGTLPPSKLNFWEEIKKAIKYIIDNNLHGRFDEGLEKKTQEEIFNELKNDFFNKNLTFNKDGNVYVERQIVLGKNFPIEGYDKSTPDNEDPMILYKTLIDRYNHNVGGCWSYKKGNALSYCTLEKGAVIVFKGFIRCEDINFVKTILLNYHYSTEHEIRVKPNAKIELFEVDVNGKYKFPLRGNLIVSATYFGNNGHYKGDYAFVDDGFGNHQYMDREGNIKDKLETKFHIIGEYHNGFAKIKRYDDEYCSFIDKEGKILSDSNGNELWFYNVEDFNEYGLAKVQYDSFSYSLIDNEGKILRDSNGNELWFIHIEDFNEYGFAEVKTFQEKYSLINSNGKLLSDSNGNDLWLNKIEHFNEYDLLKVENAKGGWSFLNKEGKILSDSKGNDLWFYNVKDFDENGNAWVQNKELKWTLINKEGDLLKDSKGNKIWFWGINDFYRNGYAWVQNDNGKWSLINEEGDILSDSNGSELWFIYISGFNEYGFAKVKNDEGYSSLVDTKGNILHNSNGNELWFRVIYFVNDDYYTKLQNKEGKWSLINKKGKILHDSNGNELWFSYIDFFNNKKGYYKAQSDKGKYYYIDKQGNFYDYDTEEPIPSPLQEKRKENSLVITESLIKDIINETINILFK